MDLLCCTGTAFAQTLQQDNLRLQMELVNTQVSMNNMLSEALRVLQFGERACSVVVETRLGGPGAALSAMTQMHLCLTNVKM